MYKLLFIIIALFVIMFSISKCNEGFADTTSTPIAVPITSDNVADYIYKIYKADVKAIQNLADIAQKLQAGGVTVPGKMIIQNGLDVTNDTKLNGKLDVTGATTLSSTLGVTGATTLKDTLGVTGATTLSTLQVGQIKGNLNVVGNTSLSDTLGVTGATTLSTLGVTGATTLSTLGVTGATTLSTLGVKDIVVNGKLTMNNLATLTTAQVSTSLVIDTNNNICKRPILYAHWYVLNSGPIKYHYKQNMRNGFPIAENSGTVWIKSETPMYEQNFISFSTINPTYSTFTPMWVSPIGHTPTGDIPINLTFPCTGYWQISCNMYFYKYQFSFFSYLHINKNYNHINTKDVAASDSPTLFAQACLPSIGFNDNHCCNLNVQTIIPITSITDYVNICYYNHTGGMTSARSSLTIYRIGDI